AAEVVMKHARRVDKPDDAVLVAAKEIGAIGPKGDSPRPVDVAVQRELTIVGQRLGDIAGDAHPFVRAVDAKQPGGNLGGVVLGAIADIKLTIDRIYRDISGVAEAGLL